MYRCQICAALVPAGTREIRVVVETRLKIYPERIQKHHAHLAREPAGKGYETVREKRVCPVCSLKPVRKS